MLPEYCGLLRMKRRLTLSFATIRLESGQNQPIGDKGGYRIGRTWVMDRSLTFCYSHRSEVDWCGSQGGEEHLVEGHRDLRGA